MEICTLYAMVTLMLELLTTRLTQNLAKWMETTMNRFAMYHCLNPTEHPRIVNVFDRRLLDAHVMG